MNSPHLSPDVQRELELRLKDRTRKVWSIDRKSLKAAIDLLLPPKYRNNEDARGKCGYFIHDVMNELHRDVLKEARKVATVSGPTKAEIKKLIAALKRAQVSMDRLPADAREQFFELHLQHHIGEAEALLAEGSAPKHRVAFEQKAAVKGAAILLQAFGHRLTVTRLPKEPQKRSVTRRYEWHQLSSLLYGKPEADLFRHMRDFVKQQASAKPARQRAAAAAGAAMRLSPKAKALLLGKTRPR